MRIGVNAAIIGEHPTGLGVYTVALLRELARSRDDLIVYTSAPGILDGVRARIRRIPAGVRPERGMRGHLARVLWLQTGLRLRLRLDRISALLNTVPEAVLGTCIPQVTVVHDLLPLAFPAEYPRQQHYFRHLVPRFIRTSRVVVADSESTRREIGERFGFPTSRVHVVYPGYDPETFRVEPSTRGFGGPSPGLDTPEGVGYVLYVGNLMPHKNVLGLLEAFALLRRHCPRARLVIRGQGQPVHDRAVRERVDQLGLSEAVAFPGYAGRAALRDLYAGAACLAFPSLGEGFGLPILEAMACGTPVVTSNRSSLQEVAGGAAITVDPTDAAGLADAMARVLADPALRSDLRRRGLERAKAFAWRRTAEAISELIDGAAKRGSGRDA